MSIARGELEFSNQILKTKQEGTDRRALAPFAPLDSPPEQRLDLGCQIRRMRRI
jgi:hypothetical protein